MNGNSPAVEIEGLTKRFGEAVALDGLTLSVPAGSVFGFLGPNGAGKTTTLRILTGLASPTTGSARVLGHDLRERSDEARRATGFLPDVPGFYPWMTARDFLLFAGRLFGLEGRALADRADALLDMAGLGSVTARIGGFSRGMKQRLGIAQALINAPSLLLLDEPTSALDPIGRREVLEMIGSLRGRTTVFFSTHILGDVERVCDTAAILHRGKVLAHAPVPELKRRAGADRIEVDVEGDASTLVARLSGAAWIRSIESSGAALRASVVDLEAAGREIPAAVAALGLGLKRYEASEGSLEELFVQLVEGGRA
ncbi:MAG TPA: ABC transporter ATP-binding protein [Gemmatimonadales bacterium]|nr:ABC transporter ATP-binding protein [Gemmatimonadales bacterium]